MFAAPQAPNPLAHMMGQAVIGQDTYTLTKVAAYPHGMTIFRKLHKFVLPLMGEALQGLVASGALSLKDVMESGAVLAKQGLLTRVAAEIGVVIADDEFFGLINQLWTLGDLRCNGKSLSGEPMHFNERGYDRLYRLAWFALEHNYGAVFADAAGRLHGLGDSGQSPSRPAT